MKPEEDRQRREAEKVRLNAKLREIHALNVRLAIIARGKREAARRAAVRRAREKARRKKAATNPLQALWDANGAAIYAANQAFKTKYGKNMSAKVRKKAIKDATRNGHFNAGAYAGNLVKAVTPPPPPPNPYAGAADRIRAAANEIDDEKKIGYQDAPLPKKPSYVVPDMSWKRDDIRAAEDYQKNKELQEGLRAYYEGRKFGEDGKYQGDVLADYRAGKDWAEKALVEPYLNPELANDMFPEPEGTLNLRERASRWLVPREENFVRHPPSFLSVSYQKNIPFTLGNLFTDELISAQPSARNLREGFFFQRTALRFEASSATFITSNPSGRLNFHFSNGRIILKGSQGSSGDRTDFFVQPGALSFGQIATNPRADNVKDISISAYDIDLVGPNWLSVKVSNATGVVVTTDHVKLPTGEEYVTSSRQLIKAEMEVHRYPRALAAIALGSLALVDAGLGTAIAQAIPAAIVFLGEASAKISSFLQTLSTIP